MVEAQTQDPSKIQSSAQVGSPIRNLTQNPIESSIPASTPRVLNVVGAQSPTPDYSGMHAMLSSAPVPPPHVAAQLIRAMMTPPGQGSVVAPQRPYTAPVSNPASGGSSVVAPQVPQPPSASPQQAGQSQPSSSGVSNNVPGPSFSRNPFSYNSQSASFSPVSQPHQSAPFTLQHLLGNHAFLGGTVGDALAGAGGLFSKLGGLFGNGLRAAESEAPAAGSLLEDLPAFF